LRGVSSDALQLAIHAVEPTLIRVDSDEVTYNLHILLRFEIERRLFSGALSVQDLPEAWGQLSQELLGLVPRRDAEGVLQDVHWSSGAFGYFPSYCVGNMLAAQLWYALRADIPDLDHRMASGDFACLLSWLRTHVHQHARTVDVLTLTQEATGAPLSSKALLRYLRERYGPLYLAGES
jgi:carboxypeptidase Taq